MYDITLDRYYDRYEDNPHYTNYKKMLFRAGDALQSAEMNEIQSTLKNDISLLSNRYMINGEFISKGSVKVEIEAITQEGTSDISHNIIMLCEEGIIFSDGDFVSIEPGVLTVSGISDIEISDFLIGVRIKEENISPLIDETLKDPAVETINYKQDGSFRLKITGKWMLEDDYQDGLDGEKFLPVFRIKRGEIYNTDKDENNEQSIDTFEKNVTNIVAGYDRNANGNYLIDGYEVEFMERIPQLVSGSETPEDLSDDVYEVDQLGPFNFSVADGNANVDGYNYQRDISQEISLEKLIDFELSGF